MYQPNSHYHKSTGTCSPECKTINERQIKRKYKHSDKGRITEMRWRNNPKRDEINKKYKQNSKYAQQEARHLAKLYKQIRKSDWWDEQSKKGCKNCGGFDRLGVDHIVARVNGGTDDYKNLQILCSRHNGEKWVK